MRILMLSWEFPPRSVGGLAQHVYDLATALVKAGEEVHLITCAADKAKARRLSTVSTSTGSTPIISQPLTS